MWRRNLRRRNPKLGNIAIESMRGIKAKSACWRTWNAEVMEVEEAVRSCLNEESTSEVKVSMTKRPFTGTRKEARALRLIKATHIKIGWVSCRVRRRTTASKCFRCLGCRHLADQCSDTDRSKSCWKCDAEGHTAAACTGKPQCYLCAERRGNPRIDHLPGTLCTLCEENDTPWSNAKADLGGRSVKKKRGVLSLVRIASAESHTACVNA